MAMRRLLALAAAATVAADVVQVAVLCNYIEARIADRQDCDAIIAAVDAINDKTDGVLDGLLPGTILNLSPRRVISLDGSVSHARCDARAIRR